MKKILLFLTGIITILTGNLAVNAATDGFYEAEYIDNIYIVRYNKKTNIKYYQKARVYRRNADAHLAYCLQPFVTFNPEDNVYQSVDNLPQLTEEQKQKIIDIIGLGYGYPSNGYNLKWYAVTQLMIWQTVEPNNEFYFTDTLNGNKINDFDDEIATINKLIEGKYKLPSFDNQTFYGIAGKPITIEDTNNQLGNFSTPQGIIKEGNKITTTNNEKGCYEIEFSKNYSYSSPILFYYNPNNQQLATVGSPNNTYAHVKFCFNELELNIKKVDAETNSNESTGEASLKGTVFTLYNDKMEKITDLSLDENMEINITSNDYNLDYGIYYIKEKEAGVGYLENNETYKIEFTPDNTKVELLIKNKVIENELVIQKYYGDGITMEEEANIIFEIYDSNNNLVEEITTNEDGIAKITLPYGHYKIVQKNTTDGYTKVEPFNVFIDDPKEEYYYIINDYEEEKEEEIISIEVPNTSTKSNYQLLTLILLPTYFVKKKFN